MREGWSQRSLGDVATIYNGNSINADEKKKKYLGQTQGLPFIATKDVGNDGVIDYENGVRIPNYTDFKIAHPDSVFVCAEGGSAGKKVAFVEQEVCFGNKLFALQPKKALLNGRYLYYFVQSQAFKEQFKQLITGIIGGVSSKKFKEIPIILSPLPEQQRIVDILDREFAKIDALKANAEKSLQAAKDLFRHISNGYYNEPSPVSKLGDECIFVRGPFGGSLKKSCFVSSGYPVYEQQHAIYSTFTFRYFVNEEKYNEMKRFTTHPGDLIMSCSGTIGKVAIIPEDAPIGIINQALLKLTPKKKILPEYLKWYMQSISFEKDIQRHSKGAAIQNVASVAILKEIAIPVPTIEKQKQIVARLDDLNERCNALQENYQKTLTLCDDLKQSLLRKAFNGEL